MPNDRHRNPEASHSPPRHDRDRRGPRRAGTGATALTQRHARGPTYPGGGGTRVERPSGTTAGATAGTTGAHAASATTEEITMAVPVRDRRMISAPRPGTTVGVGLCSPDSPLVGGLS